MPRDHSLQWYLAHKKRIELLLVALLLLVKMLNQEFLIRLSQVTYIKSAGNYQELYVDGRVHKVHKNYIENIPESFRIVVV